MVDPAGVEPTSVVCRTTVVPVIPRVEIYGERGRSRTYDVSNVTGLQPAATQPTVASRPYWSWLWVTVPADVNIAALQAAPPP